MKNAFEFRVSFFVLIVIVSCISLWFFRTLNFCTFWVVCSLIFLLIISTIMTFLNGESLWWYLALFLVSFLMAIPVQLAFLNSFFQIKSTNVALTLLLSFPIVGYFTFNWGYDLCEDNVFEEAIKSKKINTVDGTFIPCALIFALISLKSEQIERLLIRLLFYGSLFIMVSAITLLSHWTGKYISDAQLIGVVMGFYLFNMTYLIVLSVSVKEFFWIKKWEAEKMKKMRFIYAVNPAF